MPTFWSFVTKPPAPPPGSLPGWIARSSTPATAPTSIRPRRLLDCLTIRRRFGKLENLRIGIVGDIRNSRVARSNIDAFTALGAVVTLIAPPTLLPLDLSEFPVAVSHSLDDVLPELDVVYLLRIQLERGSGPVFPSLHEYVERYGIDRRRLEALPPEGVVMHPGPMNRGVEISPGRCRSPAVADSRPGHQRRCHPDGGSVPIALGGQSGGAAMRSIAIRNGRVLTPDGLIETDVLITTAGSRLSVEHSTPRRRSMRRAVGSARASSTFMSTSANPVRSGRKTSPAVRGRRPPADTPRSSRCPTPIRSIDAGHRARYVTDRGRQVGLCEVVPAGAITMGRLGETLSHLDEMWAAGVRIFTDDGSSVEDAGLLRLAMEYVAERGGVDCPTCRGSWAVPRRTHARGLGFLPARNAGVALGGRRGGGGPRPRPGPTDRGPLPRPARVVGGHRASSPPGEGETA